MDWGNVVHFEKRVNPTKLFNAEKKLVEAKTASARGIVISGPTIAGDSYVSFGISHEVGNPFCKMGAIRYSLPAVRIWRNGLIEVRGGSRQPVPAHEAYGLFFNADMSTEWVPMYRGKQGDFVCLAGGCPSQDINASHRARD